MAVLTGNRAPGRLSGLSADSEDQARFFILLDEPLDDRQGGPQEALDFFGGAVGRAKPNEFGWLTEQNASFLEVRIFRHNREAIVLGILPNGGIVRVSESAIMNMERPWIGIR